MWVKIDDRHIVSDSGAVATFKRRTRHGGEIYRHKELSTSVNARGLVTVGITGRGSVSLARIVATVYIPNPDTLPYVGYRDGNPLNCEAANLYWTNSRGA